MKQYYVAFDDSDNDPTYASLDDAYFVVSHSDSGMGNPCVENCQWVSVAPNNHDELRRYAEVMGWEVREDNGRLVLVTNITK